MRARGIAAVGRRPRLSGGQLYALPRPEALPLLQPGYVVPLLAELGFCLWLLIRGIRMERSAERTASRAAGEFAVRVAV